MTSQPETSLHHDFTAMRRVMVESQLRPSDVNDPVVIGAMAVTPREDFVPDARQATCYMDRAVPLGTAGRMLNPPLAAGLMLDRAQLRSDDNVLIVGAGTGYLAALLSPLVASVVALEEDKTLAAAAKTNLKDYQNIGVVTGDLGKGHAKKGPYSLIFIDGAAEILPEALTKQLTENGRLLTGLVEDGVTRVALGNNRGGVFGIVSFADSDVTPLPHFAAPKKYEF